MSIGKKELLAHLSAGTGLSKLEAERILGVLTRFIQHHVVEGEKVILPGLGGFETQFVEEKKGRNPKTGEQLLIPAHRKIRYSPASIFKRIVSKKS